MCVQLRLLGGTRATGLPVSVAVVGAGACVLPSWLASLSPCCRVTAVEQLAEVAVAARQCFGVDAACLEQLLTQEGTEFIGGCAESSYDAVLVTAGGGGGGGGGEQLAPPASMALPDFCASVLKTLRPGGIYATNILCRTEAGERKVVRAFRKAVVDVGFPSRGVHIATTGAPPHTNSLLFACAPGTDDSPSADKVDSATIQQTGLQQRHGQLTTLPANVAWQTWEQWDAEN